MSRCTFLLICLFYASHARAGSCVNRSVRVVAPKKSFQQIALYFALFSSLPYQVTLAGADDSTKYAEIDISYSWPGKLDDYPSPNSMELGQTVYEVLKPKLKEWGIQRIQALVDFKVDC